MHKGGWGSKGRALRNIVMYWPFILCLKHQATNWKNRNLSLEPASSGSTSFIFQSSKPKMIKPKQKSFEKLIQSANHLDTWLLHSRGKP